MKHLGLEPVLEEVPLEGPGRAVETAFRHLFRVTSFNISSLSLSLKQHYDPDSMNLKIEKERLKTWHQMLTLLAMIYGRFQSISKTGEASRPCVKLPLKGKIEKQKEATSEDEENQGEDPFNIEFI